MHIYVCMYVCMYRQTLLAHVLLWLVDEFGRLSVTEISNLSYALCTDNYMTQVGEDAAGLCAQLLDSLPRASHLKSDSSSNSSSGGSGGSNSSSGGSSCNGSGSSSRDLQREVVVVREDDEDSSTYISISGILVVMVQCLVRFHTKLL